MAPEDKNLGAKSKIQWPKLKTKKKREYLIFFCSFDKLLVRFDNNQKADKVPDCLGYEKVYIYNQKVKLITKTK